MVLTPVLTGEAIDPNLPARVSSTEQVGYLLEAAHAPSTRRAYTLDWTHWVDWCRIRQCSALPAVPLDVATYLAELAGDGLRPSTIGRRAAAIAHHHRQHGELSPTAHAGVRQVLRGIRRDSAQRGNVARQAEPLTVAHLRRMVAALPDDASGRRDAAILLVGFALGLRASEIVSLDVRDVTEGQRGGLDVTLRRSKTDQEGVGTTVALCAGVHAQTCPVTALRAWLHERHAEAGPLFTSVGKGNTQRLGEEPLDPSAVTRVIRRAARRGDVALTVSSHSLRRGYATAAYAAGVPEQEIARTGRWRSVNVMRSYDGSSRWESPASGQLGL